MSTIINGVYFHKRSIINLYLLSRRNCGTGAPKSSHSIYDIFGSTLCGRFLGKEDHSSKVLVEHHYLDSIIRGLNRCPAWARQRELKILLGNSIHDAIKRSPGFR